jgi:5-(carboxyamino)imidazole ribonucleotide synthase
MDLRTGLPVVGMIGGGQLARMCHQAAIALGQSLRVLAVSADDSAAMVATDTQLGIHTDRDALRRFAKGCDVLTFDHEHVPGPLIDALVADGVVVRPAAAALRFAQDKKAMRDRLAGLGIAVPRWRAVPAGSDPAELDRAAAAMGGWPVVGKARTGGYDGRGVWLLDSAPPATELLAAEVELLIEELVPLRRELAAVVARSPWGQVAAYPVVQTVQRDGICTEVLAPAPGLDPEVAVTAQQLAIRIAGELDVIGLLAVELFETTGGALLVNELAMRPHNSAHWTIEGARTSQFEQHLRAVLDYPLGETGLTAPAIAMANVLGGPSIADGGSSMGLDERLHHMFAAFPDVKVHLYGKQVRPSRKIGHVTALGDRPDEVRARALAAAGWLRDGTGD